MSSIVRTSTLCLWRVLLIQRSASPLRLLSSRSSTNRVSRRSFWVALRETLRRDGCNTAETRPRTCRSGRSTHPADDRRGVEMCLCLRNGSRGSRAYSCAVVSSSRMLCRNVAAPRALRGCRIDGVHSVLLLGIQRGSGELISGTLHRTALRCVLLCLDLLPISSLLHSRVVRKGPESSLRRDVRPAHPVQRVDQFGRRGRGATSAPSFAGASIRSIPRALSTTSGPWRPEGSACRESGRERPVGFRIMSR